MNAFHYKKKVRGKNEIIWNDFFFIEEEVKHIRVSFFLSLNPNCYSDLPFTSMKME